MFLVHNPIHDPKSGHWTDITFSKIQNPYIYVALSEFIINCLIPSLSKEEIQHLISYLIINSHCPLNTIPFFQSFNFSKWWNIYCGNILLEIQFCLMKCSRWNKHITGHTLLYNHLSLQSLDSLSPGATRTNSHRNPTQGKKLARHQLWKRVLSQILILILM